MEKWNRTFVKEKNHSYCGFLKENEKETRSS